MSTSVSTGEREQPAERSREHERSPEREHARERSNVVALHTADERASTTVSAHEPPAVSARPAPDRERSRRGITDAQVEQIRTLKISGASQRDVARDLGISNGSVAKYWH